MTKRFSTLRAKMPAKARTRSRQRAEELIRVMSLNELRRARRVTQGRLATAMQTSQSEVSKLEQRTDTYVKVFELADREARRALPRAQVPNILLRSPKITRRLTTDWFARRVADRHSRCVARAAPGRGR